jgi:tRNA pseudouridine55 synthase
MFCRKAKGQLPPYATIEKEVGETPLVTAERLRTEIGIPESVPLAYAGRLDPMASGKLLILIGDECKVQEKYHAFDKEYVVEILFGVASDTGDVLGLLSPLVNTQVTKQALRSVLHARIGTISLPYPHFSSKTVKGKPLHTWTLENRLNEIDIPTKTSMIHKLSFGGLRTVTKSEVLKTVREKIETIPPVTDARKALGADFRRDDVRASWNGFEQSGAKTYQILTFTCIASSGTYMRSLAGLIAQDVGTCGLAYSIHRTKIGTYIPFTRQFGFWKRSF